MMNPDCDIYEAFKAHLQLDDTIDQIENIDIYAAWALWKTAYKAGCEAALKEENKPPCGA